MILITGPDPAVEAWCAALEERGRAYRRAERRTPDLAARDRAAAVA